MSSELSYSIQQSEIQPDLTIPGRELRDADVAVRQDSNTPVVEKPYVAQRRRWPQREGMAGALARTPQSEYRIGQTSIWAPQRSSVSRTRFQ